MRIRSKLFLTVVCALSVLGFLAVAPVPVTAAAPRMQSMAPSRLPGLQAAARLTQDRNGITYIMAGPLHDLFFMQGWVQARDRLFQMDVSRRLQAWQPRRRHGLHVRCRGCHRHRGDGEEPEHAQGAHYGEEQLRPDSHGNHRDVERTVNERISAAA